MTEGSGEAEEFGRSWSVERLRTPPMIAPARQFTYPHAVPGEEEAMARGSVQWMVRPATGGTFLATCAMGYKDSAVPTGSWACPHADELCLVAGGYGYLVNTAAPERSTMARLRPVVAVRPVVREGLLLLIGFHTILAWGADGEAWETARLTWEGIRMGEVAGGQLHGWGWEMMADRELPFSVDLRTGAHTGGGYLR